MPEDRYFAIICAYNPRNSGMYSVDLAAQQFFEEQEQRFQIFSIQFKRRYSILTPLHRVKHKVLTSKDQLKGFTDIVFWGDFLTNPYFGSTEFAKRDVKLGHSKNNEEAFMRWKDFLLPPLERSNQKFWSIGSNFMEFPLPDGSRERERIEETKVFFKNFSGIFPRDSKSTENLIQFTSGANIVEQGLDVATLLDTEAAFPKLRKLTENSTFAYFFARSGFENTSKLIEKTAKRTGLTPVNVKDWLELSKLNPDQSFFRSIQKIKQAHFVISDTYHLLINSLALGKPVLGVGRQSIDQLGSCGDLKKEVLFRDLGIADSYFCFPTGEVTGIDTLAEVVAQGNVHAVEKFRAVSDRYRIFLEARLGLRKQQDKDLKVSTERTALNVRASH